MDAQSQVLGWLLEHPEFVIIIPMLALCYMLWFLVARHFPFLLSREDKKTEELLARESDRSKEAAAREDKRSTEVTGAIKEMAGAIQGLDRTMQVGLNGKKPTKRRESTRPNRPPLPESRE